MHDSGRLRTDTDRETMITRQKQRFQDSINPSVWISSLPHIDLISAFPVMQTPAHKALAGRSMFPVHVPIVRKCPQSVQKIVYQLERFKIMM